MGGKNILNKIDFHLSDSDLFLINDDDCYSLDDDFYPVSDNRVWKSYVEDIDGGDNFADYCGYIFKILEEEEYYGN